MKSPQNLNSHRTYPIANTLRSQFNWFQYRLLMRIGDESKREFYELERQINAQFYERLLLSSDKESVMWVLEFEQNENATHGATS